MTSAEALEALLSTGLIESVRANPQMTDEPRVPAFQAQLKAEASKRVGGRDCTGQGTDFSPELAQVKAAAETLERFCQSCWNEADFRLGAYGAFDDQVDPAAFLCYSTAQIGDRRTHIAGLRGAERRWIKARDLLGGVPLGDGPLGEDVVWIPAELVYLGFPAGEAPIRRDSNSSGAALGPRGSGRAVDAGLRELVERDAVIGWWHGIREAARVVNLPDDLAGAVAALARYRLETILLDITPDLETPTAVAVTLDRTGGGPAVTVGAAARPSWAEAARHALIESLSYRVTTRLEGWDAEPDSTFGSSGSPESPESIEERIRFWYSPERIACIEPLLETAVPLEYSKIAGHRQTFDELLGQLRARDWRAYSADITCVEVEAAGFEAVRCLVPELHPIWFRESAKALWSVHFGELPEADLPNPLA